MMTRTLGENKQAHMYNTTIRYRIVHYGHKFNFIFIFNNVGHQVF
jgi:hypothetical protein